MITEVKKETITYILSDTAQKAYEKIKALILRIFTLLKGHKEGKNLKEEFYESYVDFARKLDDEGHHEESYSYMIICGMYYRLMDRRKELMEHESFFLDLFNAFDELLSVKFNDPENYDEKYLEFESYSAKMREYYYRNLAIPSTHFNKDTLDEITNNLSGDLL